MIVIFNKLIVKGLKRDDDTTVTSHGLDCVSFTIQHCKRCKRVAR